LNGRDYKTEINNAVSLEEVEVIREEVLLQIAEKSQNSLSSDQFFSNRKGKSGKNYSSSQVPTAPSNDKIIKDLIQELSKINNKQSNLGNIQDLENKLIKTKQKSSELKSQFHNLQKKFSSEAQNLNQEIQNLKEQNKFQWGIKNNPWFILFIIGFIGSGVYVIFKLKSVSKAKSIQGKIQKKPNKKAYF